MPKTGIWGCSLGKTMVISSISSHLSPITMVLYQLITSTAPPSGCVGSPSMELHYYSYVMLIIAAPSHTRIHGTENCGQVLLTHVFLCIWVWVKMIGPPNTVNMISFVGGFLILTHIRISPILIGYANLEYNTKYPFMIRQCQLSLRMA